MNKKTVSIVIPFYNEKESLLPLLGKLDAIKSDTWNIVEYVLVDDGSTDGSFETVKRMLGKAKHHITLIRFRKNLGKSAALAVGFDKAKGDYFVTLDADLQDEPSEIPNLLKKLDDGYDFVIGWRRNRHDSFTKKLSSKIFNTLVAKLYHVDLHDMNSGLKAGRSAVTDEIQLYGELHRYFPVLAVARGFKVTEVPVIHHARVHGKSKYSSKRIIHAFFDLASTLFLTTFEHEPLQAFGATGMVGIVVGIFILSYLSVLHFMGETIGHRPLLSLGMLLVLFGMQMVSTGLVGELIIHKERNKSQNYPIEEILS